MFAVQSSFAVKVNNSNYKIYNFILSRYILLPLTANNFFHFMYEELLYSHDNTLKGKCIIRFLQNFE